MNAPEHTLNEDYTGPGAVLQQARLHAGMTQSQVATHLNMLTSQIVALEEENYGRLAGEIFVIGYLRNYAKLLCLNENQLVALYQAQKAHQAQKALTTELTLDSSDTDISAGSALTMRAQHREHKTVYGLALSVFLVAGLWLYNQNPEPIQPNDSNVVRVDTVDGTTVVGPLTEYSDESFDISSPEFQTHSIEMTGTQLDNQQVEPSAGEMTLASVDTQVSQLSFYFTGDCWVEVRDGDDSLIYANLKSAEDELQLIGKPPFRVILGYAPAVTLSFNGQPVDIESHRHDNMAKLTLGSS